MSLPLRNEEDILDELFDSSSDKEEDDNIEENSYEEDIYDSDDDPEYFPDQDELETYEEEMVDIIKHVEERESDSNQLCRKNNEGKKRKGSLKSKKPKEKRRKEANPKTKARNKEENCEEVEEINPIISIDADTLLGKDTTFVWKTQQIESSHGKTPARDIVHIRPGPTLQAKNALTAASSFKLFFTQNIMEEILKNTNSEIRIQRENYAQANHSALSDLEMEELEAFLGLLVLSATLKDNHLTTTLMFDTSYCGERYRCTTSERRFKFLLNCLRFDDRQTRATRRENNKLAPVFDIWQMLLTNCRNNYKPGSYLTIDEQLVGFRGRCPFRMYIPSKPNKYGMKIVMCCDSGTKYMIDAKPYLGKGTYPPKVPAGTYFVEELIQTVKGSNRNITLDNWFTSVPLVRHLLHEHKLTVVGTIKKNKPELPAEATDKKFMDRNAPTSLFLFHQDMSVVSFKPNKKKLVLLVSSMHGAPVMNEETKKPEIVHVYNSTKGGVDSFDQMCQNMNHCRKTKRWPLCFFFNMINISSINAYVIYVHNMYARGQKPLSRINYMLSLHRELTENWQNRRLQKYPTMKSSLRKSIMSLLGTTERPVNVDEDQQGPRKYCFYCHYSKRRFTTTYCRCGKPICREHAVKSCRDCV